MDAGLASSDSNKGDPVSYGNLETEELIASVIPCAAMAMQAGNSVAPCNPHVHYSVLYKTPEHVHKFYHDESFLGRPDSNGTMTCVTTMHAISEQILSTDFTSSLIEIENVDTQLSHKDGVLILVTGSFTGADTVKHRFTQSFFLAPQENGGYFVLNDVLRYTPERPSIEINEALDNHVNENTQIGTFPDEPETTSVKEGVDPDLPSAENISNNDKVINPSAIDNSPQENSVCVKVVSEDAEKIPEAAPAPPASAQKDVTKKSYASIVKVMTEGAPPPPVAKPKPKPKPTVKGAENVEKSVSLPAKPARAADSTPPSDKNVSVGQGYSVFVKNLPFNATVEMVEEEFRKFGAIKPGGIQVRNRQPDRFCFGFVEFESQQSMQAAIEASPIRFGSKDSYVEEKRTTTRVVNGVITHGDNNGNVRGSRFQPGRGGYRDDNFRGQGVGFVNNGSYRDGDNFRGRGVGSVNNGSYRDGDNFRGRGAGSANNGNYRDGDNMRNEFRNRNEYAGHGRGPQGNSHHQNGDGYHQNWNGYRQNENGYRQDRNGYRQNENGYYQNGNGYHQPRPFHSGNGNGNGRSARFNGLKQTPVAA